MQVEDTSSFSYLFQKLAEHFTVVGPSLPLIPTDSELKGSIPRYDGSYKGVLVDCFPTTNIEGSYLANLPLFCFPDGIRISKTRRSELLFPFVLTDGIGQRIYITCMCFDELVSYSDVVASTPAPTAEDGTQLDKTDSWTMVESEESEYVRPGDKVYVSKCICVSSSHPIYSLAKDFLISLYRKVRYPDEYDASIPIEQYISHFLVDTPMPPATLPLKITIPTPIKRQQKPTEQVPDAKFLYFSSTPHDDFPIADFPVRLLFLCLDTENFLKLYTSVLLERRIVLCSRSNALLSYVAEGLRTLIYPFTWPHVYIPVLPNCLLDYLQALPPFIMGVNATYSSELSGLKDVVVAYLDSNKIVSSTEDPLPVLPEKETRALMQKVRKHVHPELANVDIVFSKNKHDEQFDHQRRIRLAFLKYFALLLEGYENSLDKTTGIFEKASFLKNKPDTFKDFLDAFIDTQLFETFTSERLSKKTKGDMFDLAATTQSSCWKKFKQTTKQLSFSFEVPPPKSMITQNQVESNISEEQLHFPKLSSDFFSNGRTADVLSKLGEYIATYPNTPQLYAFRARLLVEYEKQYLKSIDDMKTAYELDETSVNDEFLECILRRLASEELEALKTANTLPTEADPESKDAKFKRLIERKASNILEIRKSLLQSSELKNSATQFKEVVKDEGLPSSPSSPRAQTGKKMNMGDILKQIDLPPSGAMPKVKFVKFMKHLGLISKEEVGNKLFALLSERKLEIKNRKITKLFESISSIYANSHQWQSTIKLPEQETILWTAKATNSQGDKGQLFLTSTSIHWKKTGETGSSLVLPLVEAESLTREGAKPGGFMVLAETSTRLKISFRDGRDPMYFVVWNWKERDVWMCYMMEVLVASHIARDLVDPRFILTATQSIILTDAFFRATNKFSKSLFSFTNYPNDNWCKIVKKLASAPVLNTEFFWEIQARSAIEVVTDLLTSIIDLFYSSVLEDGSSVNTASILSNQLYTNYLMQAAELQQVDITSLTIQEKTAFFINLWNVMIVHSYILVGFPTCELDFRYITHTAYYSVGGTIFCLADIMHGVLRGNQASPWYSEPRFSTNDPRVRNVIPDMDPRIHFTLATHNKSSPSIHIVNPINLEMCLQTAAEEFCQEQVSVSTVKKEITVPKTFDWYQSDFGERPIDLMRWVSTFLLGQKKKELSSILEGAFTIRYILNWHPSPKPFHSYM